MTSYYCGPVDLGESMRLLADRAVDVDALVTHRLALQDIVRGFQLVMSGEDAIKVIIKPHAGPGELRAEGPSGGQGG